MKAFWLEIELLSPLIAGAETWRAMAYHGSKTIPGSSLAGLIRAEYGVIVKCSDAFPEGSLPAPPGSVKVKAPKGAYFLPSPELLHELLNDKTRLTTIDERLTKSLESWNKGLALFLKAYKGGVLKPAHGSPLTPKERLGEFVSAEEAKVEMDERTSVALLAPTRSSKPAALFHQAVLAEGQRFWAIAIGELEEGELVSALGRGRSRGLGKVRIRFKEVKMKPGGLLLSTVPLAFLKKFEGLSIKKSMMTLWREGIRYSVSALAPGSVFKEPQDCPWCVFVDYEWLLKEVMKK